MQAADYAGAAAVSRCLATLSTLLRVTCAPLRDGCCARRANSPLPSYYQPKTICPHRASYLSCIQLFLNSMSLSVSGNSLTQTQETDEISIRRRRRRPGPRKAVDSRLRNYNSALPNPPPHLLARPTPNNLATFDGSNMVVNRGVPFAGDTVGKHVRPDPQEAFTIPTMSRQSKSSSDMQTLTVHEFLQRTSRTPARVPDRRRRTAVVDLKVYCGDDDYRRTIKYPSAVSVSQPESSHCNSSNFEEHQGHSSKSSMPPSLRRTAKARPRRKRPAKPLKQRLFEAAVYSHIEMPQTSTSESSGPAHIAGRRPLSFYPVRKLSSESGVRKRKWDLIDPRKRIPDIKTASFASGGLSSNSAPNVAVPVLQKPMSAWRRDFILASLDTVEKALRKSQKRIPAPERTHYRPLRFVPLEVHEEAFKKMSRSKTSTEPALTSARSACRSKADEEYLADPTPLLFEELPINSPADAYPKASLTCLPTPCTQSDTTRLISSSPFATSEDSPNRQVVGRYAAFGNSPQGPAHGNPERPLRPLTSMMGQLRETARNVTREQLVSKRMKSRAF
ncbi:hypothetical protein EW146_g4818 [Bondarzewia mesenterica]|uniref:Uncharacterized protein n=1 Tax=Bondarzewia mesenterica TaxID=1095465 RepID=A0A4S4LTE6_9AGAM|nr:hypothetical protein EW146_g4818 [Bondarzewia mesenterica]